MAQAQNNPGTSKRDALAERLTAHFAPQIEAMELELLQLRLLGSARSGMRLDVRVDRPLGRGAVSLNDCRRVSRLLSTQLDELEAQGRQDLTLDGAYELEVSSPGMDRILRHEADFRRFLGLTAKLVARKHGTQESVLGVLVACADGVVTLDVGKKKPQRQLLVADLVQANLAPTFAEWLALGEKLKAESAALGEQAPDEAIELDESEDEAEDLDDDDQAD